jgi:hypothetical protein
MKPKHRTVCTRRKYKSIRSRSRSIDGKLFDVSHVGKADDAFFRVDCSLWVDEAEGGGAGTLPSVYEQLRPFRSHCSQGDPPAHLVLALLQSMHERSTRRLLSPASVLSSLIPLLLRVLPDEYTHSSPYRRHRRHPPGVRSHLTFVSSWRNGNINRSGETRGTHFAVAADTTANRLHLGRARCAIFSRHVVVRIA